MNGGAVNRRVRRIPPFLRTFALRSLSESCYYNIYIYIYITIPIIIITIFTMVTIRIGEQPPIWCLESLSAREPISP